MCAATPSLWDSVFTRTGYCGGQVRRHMYGTMQGGAYRMLDWEMWLE